jgi:hypothetical protein
MFTTLLEAIKTNSQRLNDVRDSLQASIDRNPKWLAGRAMMGIVEIHTNQKAEGRSRIETLLNDDAVWKELPFEICWVLGQELIEFPESSELALRLLREADKRETVTGNDIQYSPVAFLAKRATKAEDKADIKERLAERLRKVSNQAQIYGDPDYEAYQRISQKLGAGQMYESLGYPIDVILTLNDVDDDADLAKASRFYGSTISLRQQISKAIETAKKSITDDVMVASLDSLLPLKEKQPVELLLKLPALDKMPERKMTSGLSDILSTTATKPETRRLVSERLTELMEKRPNDFSVRLLNTLWLIERDCNADDLVLELKRLLDLGKLEPIAEGRKANARQRAEARTISFLWLVARDILDRKSQSYASHTECRQLAEQAASLAAEASSRQLTKQEQCAVLLEWSELLARQKEWEQAEAKWNQLIQIASTVIKQPTTTTPAQPANPNAPVAEANSSRIPPLNLSQFRIVMTVHQMAATHERMDVAAKALGISLRGGMPVADPVQTPADPNRSLFISGRNNSPAEDPVETEVQSTLKKALGLWEKAKQTPAELYDALRLVVMPANRPQELRLYVDPKAIEMGKQESMAHSLVRAAARAGKLAVLKQEIEQREVDAANQLAKKVLSFLIAIETQDISTAKATMESISQDASKIVSSAANSLFGLVAITAFTVPELQSASVPLMKRLVSGTGNTSSNNDPFAEQRNKPLVSDMGLRLNRYLMGIGDEKSTLENLESALSGRAKAYQSYGDGDYVRSMQRNDLQVLAGIAGQLGLLDYTMDLMGRASDMGTNNRYYFAGTPSQPFEHVIYMLRTLGPEERYQKLHKWTMPNQEHAILRVEAVSLPRQKIPKSVVLSTERGKKLSRVELPSDVYTNLTELILAASDTGKLEGLRTEVEALDPATNSHKNLFLDLIHIYQKNDAEVTKRVSERIAKRFDKGVQPNQGVYQTADVNNWFVYPSLARACKRLGYEKEYEKLERFAPEITTYDVPSKDGDTHWVQAEGKSWNPSSSIYYQGIGPQNESSESLWRYPLEGKFSISWDFPRTIPALGFGGIWVNAPNGLITDSSGFNGELPTLQSKALSNRVEIHVDDKEVRFVVNGIELVKDKTWGTSPWLGITKAGKGSLWRNLRIEGHPTIPREVPLITQDSMDGWVSTSFGETQKQPRFTPEYEARSARTRRYVYQEESVAKPVPDWIVENGVLSAKGTPKLSLSPGESWLVYRRPMAPGETFRYEFFYSPEEKVAHPTIGPLALMLSQDAVRLHYVSNSVRDRGLYNLLPESVFADEFGKQLVDKLPLRAEDWNQVAISYRDNQWSLSINGIEVYTRPMEEGMTTDFGVFRYRHQDCLVRNAVLTGDWPESLSGELLAEINAKNRTYLSGDAEQLESLTAHDWKTFFEKDGDKDLRELIQMVLPASGKSPRFFYRVDQPETVANSPRSFMQLDCLATRAVESAHARGTLQELLAAIDEFQARNPQEKPSLDALRCLCTIQKQEEKLAIQQIDKIVQRLSAAEIDVPRNSQSAELVLAWRASLVPALRESALKLAEELQKLERDERRKSGDYKLALVVSSLVADIRYRRDWESPSETPRAPKQWTSVSFAATQRNSGMRKEWLHPSSWAATPGKVRHYGGDVMSLLLFQSPLIGEFEIVADRTTWGWQEVPILYAMHGAEPRHDLAKVMLFTSNTQREEDFTLPIPDYREKNRARFRIAVKDNNVTTYANDVKIYEQEVPNFVLPWLMIRPAQVGYNCEVENLRIIGSPKIPDEIDLTNPMAMAGWDGHQSNEQLSNDRNQGGVWNFSPTELMGGPFSSSSLRESYIRYVRPMLEDGVIEYECWYDSAATQVTEVHPVLGSCAFLLRTDGVRVHRITHLTDEPLSLLSNNEEPLSPPSQGVKWKEKSWNRVRLELKGDQLTIDVNGDVVGTIPIKDPAHVRHVGLFRYGTVTSRVRNMKYRGQWPKTLPSVAEQELAKP